MKMKYGRNCGEEWEIFWGINGRPFSIMLAFFSAFFGKTSIFFVFSWKRIASIFCHFSWLWSRFQHSEGCFQSWKPHSMSSKIALSSITFKPVWWHNTTSDKRSQLLTVYWNVNVLYELEVEQNCASLGCVYPAHGSASNMTVEWLLAGKVLIPTPSFINKQLLSITCCWYEHIM